MNKWEKGKRQITLLPEFVWTKPNSYSEELWSELDKRPRDLNGHMRNRDSTLFLSEGFIFQQANYQINVAIKISYWEK